MQGSRDGRNLCGLSQARPIQGGLRWTEEQRMRKDSPKKRTTSVPPRLRVVKGGREGVAAKADAGEPAAKSGPSDKASRGKRVQFDLETWHALNLLGRDRLMTFQEMADEAFADLLRKHGRPRDLKDALRRSVQAEKGPPKRPR